MNTNDNINAAQVNTSALTSTIAANLYHKLENTQQAIVLAACIADSYDQGEYFVDALIDGINNSHLKAYKLNEEGKRVAQVYEVEFNLEEIEKVLVELKFITEEGLIGEKLQELLDKRTEAYAPTTGPIKRKFANYGLEAGQTSPLQVEATLALEDTWFTKCAFMEDIANKVQTAMGGAENDKEAYVLAGCNNMDANKAYHSEYKNDRRGRFNQAACHGPNGAASDRSRALQDLWDVPTDYDVEVVKKAIKAEVMDMVSVPVSEVGKLMAKAIKDPVQFIIGELSKRKSERLATKPWSFVKASIIWSELMKGNKPYIGMATGLDAKCSGPQYGGLMAGDEAIAAACGFTQQQLDDAYELCLQKLVKAGFVGFTRSGIKKAYMGIFYGQGKGAYTSYEALAGDEGQYQVLEVLSGGSNRVTEEAGTRFHKAVSDSFGTKMSALRNRFLKYSGQIQGRSSHLMPDGFTIQMNYKHKVNIDNVLMEYGVDAPDVTVETANSTYKFINFQLKTLVVNESDFVRNGFVNMIQGTDALIAKLIIVNLKRMGAKHIICVHDCFRVNVTEMHLLEAAIKLAYKSLFGQEINTSSMDLPMGTDILALYFEGMDKSLKEGCSVAHIRQFFQARNGRKIRILKKINGVKIIDLINDLGNTYYFAK